MLCGPHLSRRVTNGVFDVGSFGWKTHIIITDANNNQTGFTYDTYGHVTQTNFPSSLREYCQYDA